MPLWLLGLFSGLRSALSRLWRFAAQYPWQTACVVLLAASAWCWHGWNEADAKLEACSNGRKADRAAYVAAQEQAAELAKKAKVDTEAHYRDLAERADNEADKAIADARSDAAEYIRTHRVRNEALASSASAAAPASNSGDTAVPASLPADSVILTEPDVHACADATAYAVKAHDWALGLAKASAGH